MVVGFFSVLFSQEEVLWQDGSANLSVSVQYLLALYAAAVGTALLLVFNIPNTSPIYLLVLMLSKTDDTS